jgi:hypothetical protein
MVISAKRPARNEIALAPPGTGFTPFPLDMTITVVESEYEVPARCAFAWLARIKESKMTADLGKLAEVLDNAAPKGTCLEQKLSSERAEIQRALKSTGEYVFTDNCGKAYLIKAGG